MTTSPLVELAHDIAGFTHDPLGHALYAYPWGSPLLTADGPRAWQRDTLRLIGDHLSDPATRHQPCRIAVASGHGIGKSALIAMIAKWGLDTPSLIHIRRRLRLSRGDCGSRSHLTKLPLTTKQSLLSSHIL